MKKVFKRVQTVLGTKHPTTALYENVLNQLPANEQLRLKNDIFLLAFGYWNQLPEYFHQFLINYFTHDRESLLDFVLENTLLGALRYKLSHPQLVIKVFHILERNKKVGRLSYLHLAFVLLISFDYPYKLRTLAEYLRRGDLTAGELLQLAGKIEINGDFD